MTTVSQQRRFSAAGVVAFAGFVGVLIAAFSVIALVLLSITDPANSSAAGYLPLAWAAAGVLVVVTLVSVFFRRAQLDVAAGFPWIIGGLSFLASFVPWWAISGTNPDLGSLIYRGLKVPQGIVQFWDLSLVMLSVDCSRWGFNIYVDNNGCMQDASIYAPGMVWLQYIPFSIFSQANVPALGLGMMVVSSLVLVWLARQSSGLGQILLLIAAIGGPWLLLLERGNIDAAVFWSAAVAVLIIRRWSSLDRSAALWPWIMAAAVLWLMGAWKYYPFALGVMLLPVLRIRYGWTVLVGYAVATLVYVLATWQNLMFSSASNSAMVDYGDFVVLGRVPVVARMLGAQVGADQLQVGDGLMFALAALAALWGVGVGLHLRTSRPWTSMLAIAGASLYLVSILVSGFGYGYKSVFLLLAVPLVSSLVRNSQRLLAASSLGILLLTGVQSVVVWNTVMVTTAGISAAGFALGLSGTVLIRIVFSQRLEIAPAAD